MIRNFNSMYSRKLPVTAHPWRSILLAGRARSRQNQKKHGHPPPVMVMAWGLNSV
jgi:hypothetical protein